MESRPWSDLNVNYNLMFAMHYMFKLAAPVVSWRSNAESCARWRASESPSLGKGEVGYLFDESRRTDRTIGHGFNACVGRVTTEGHPGLRRSRDCVAQ